MPGILMRDTMRSSTDLVKRNGVREPTRTFALDLSRARSVARMGAGQTTSWSVRTEFLPQAVRELHRFEVLGRLGAGGMAEVFLVRERVEPRRTAVLKRLLPTHAQDDEIREMFFD